MDGFAAYAVVGAVALVASGLTLFSGFGLGTLLLPAFAFFFPLPVAVAATAIVHLANNLFKLALLSRHAVWPVAVQFIFPAALAAAGGAYLLSQMSDLPVLGTYEFMGRAAEVTLVKLTIGMLIAAFALLDLHPSGHKLTLSRRYVPAGAFLSGLFGGLSGHQGALRSAVLIHFNLSKQAFIATGVVCAVVVDLARVSVYGQTLLRPLLSEGQVPFGLVAWACLAALAGALAGTRLLSKITLETVRRIVGVMLLLVAFLLTTGLA